MKYLLLTIAAAAVLAAPAAFAAAPAEQALACAAEDMQVFYYYLDASQDPKVRSRATACHAGKAALIMPDWLQSAVPGMLARKVWKDPEEGELSEALLWQTPVSILYEFLSKAPKTQDPQAEMAGYEDMRIRFMMSVDRVTKAGLESSFGGRGGPMLGGLNNLMRDFDEVTEAASDASRVKFGRKTADIARRSRDLFAQLFEAPRKGAGKKPGDKYSPEARVLPGYRGVSLPVSGAQALYLVRGDRVDMLVTFEAMMNTDIKEKVTATILQNVLVTGVHKPASAAAPGVVQLLCNPNEAQYAALSLVQGSNIVLVRRAPGDFELRPMEIASFRKLIK
ncbi:MAG TPA: hypothetical protein DEQ38_12670 [Elusimicrobia bacterium]|nr:MAG: hypothetical protein A2089_08595 [Elusimicrobia bacterium GWD2_63_28]HCC48952.1 hypothetical protein [Elusimicrobiota bacterium]